MVPHRGSLPAMALIFAAPLLSAAAHRCRLLTALPLAVARAHPLRRRQCGPGGRDRFCGRARAAEEAVVDAPVERAHLGQVAPTEAATEDGCGKSPPDAVPENRAARLVHLYPAPPATRQGRRCAWTLCPAGVILAAIGCDQAVMPLPRAEPRTDRGPAPSPSAERPRSSPSRPEITPAQSPRGCRSAPRRSREAGP